MHLFPPTAEHPTPSTSPDFLSLLQGIDRKTVDQFLPVKCPDEKRSRDTEEYIGGFRDRKDSIGGTVTRGIKNAPVDMASPVSTSLRQCWHMP